MAWQPQCAAEIYKDIRGAETYFSSPLCCHHSKGLTVRLFDRTPVFFGIRKGRMPYLNNVMYRKGTMAIVQSKDRIPFVVPRKLGRCLASLCSAFFRDLGASSSSTYELIAISLVFFSIF